MDIIKLKEDEIEKLDELKKLDDEFEIPKTEEEYFIINDRDMEMGYAVLEMNEIPVLKRIFIREGYRNTGYGTKLLKYIINWLRSKDYDELIVLDHKNSNKFLERLEFVRNGEIYIRDGLSFKRKKEKKS